MIHNEKVGKFILEKRKALGMNQQQLADLLGVTNKAVSKWETGEGLPDISLLPALGEVLGTTVDALLRGSEENHSTSQIEQNQNKVPSTDGPALSQYRIEKRLEQFKKQGLLALFISILGIIAFIFIWKEKQNYYSYGIGLAMEACSILFFISAIWSLQFEMKHAQKIFPESTLSVQNLIGKFFCLLMIFWSFFPCLMLAKIPLKLLFFSYSSILDFLLFLLIYITVIMMIIGFGKKKYK